MQAMRGDFYVKHGIHTAYAVLLFNLFRISTKSHLDPIKKGAHFLKVINGVVKCFKIHISTQVLLIKSLNKWFP